MSLLIRHSQAQTECDHLGEISPGVCFSLLHVGSVMADTLSVCSVMFSTANTVPGTEEVLD